MAVVALIRLCYLVAFWMILGSITTRRQWHWSASASFAEASNNLPSHLNANSSLQRRILTAFKQGIVEDGDGALASRKASQPLCFWNGVGCASGTHQVVSLNLPNSGLKGTVTPLLFSMPFLTYLNLSGNILQGSFPDNASKSLEVLDLNNNLFNGRIPACIGDLASLEFLALAGNDFTGPIPSQLGNLTNLIELNLLDSAGLEEQLPSELRACTQINSSCDSAL